MVALITEEDFDIAVEHEKLKASSVGAIVTFTGTVRDVCGEENIKDMTLEYYPGMTESEINKIINEAKQRWPLEKVTVIHRVGCLSPRDNIVFVGCASAHRMPAFDAANFIMDYLKTKAPFWKKESRTSGASWVDARETDCAAIKRWED